jgi:hypothetical protein
VKSRATAPQSSAVAITLFANEFVQVRLLAEARVAHVVRSARRAESLCDVDEAWGSVQRALTPLVRPEHGLLIDMRDAPGRNDPEFESAVARYRALTIQGFRRVAVVVRSIPGQMQIQRHVNEDRATKVRVFTDERQAFAFLRGGDA